MINVDKSVATEIRLQRYSNPRRRTSYPEIFFHRKTRNDANRRTAYFQYLCTMFVHRKKHRSGHVSIIVMDKSSGKLREVKNFGVAKSDSEADELYFKAKQWIR